VARGKGLIIWLPQGRVERFAEAVAGEGEAGFGFGEGQGEVGVGGFGPAEEGDGIDFGGGELVAFARVGNRVLRGPAVVFTEGDAPHFPFPHFSPQAISNHSSSLFFLMLAGRTSCR